MLVITNKVYYMRLDELEINQKVMITKVGGQGATRQHFLDMGLIPGEVITLIKFAPMGDPIEYRVHGYELTLRKDDAHEIEVDSNCIEEVIEDNYLNDISGNEHPGLGEGGKYHNSKTENPLSDDTILTFALVGNQNSGKTTLFNQLTGSNQHVGNFPGVTVDRKSGPMRNYPNTLVTDLPGIYSMSPYTPEEIISRNFVLDEKPKGIINVLDATTIERGLYLTMQLLELDIPMVLALNMMDEVKNNGGYIDVNAIEKKLGIPVVPISAAKNEGIDELINHAIHVAKYQEKPTVQDYCDERDHNGAVHRCLHSIMSFIEDHARDAELPLRFTASKCAEGDSMIIERLKLDQNEIETLEHINEQLEKERGLDKAAAIADMRFHYIHRVIKSAISKPIESKERERSKKIDRILTGKHTAIPVFILIMALVFFLTFEVIGPFLENLLNLGIGNLKNIVDVWMTSANVNAGLHSLVINGLFEGVGSVLGFLPVVVTLFFFLSLLEDSGYIARIAFVMDNLLRKIGLSGRSIVPLLVGFGCTVPAVMSTRTLPSERDRKMTILLTPFMSCPAKLPIYIFFSMAFFPKYAGLVTVALYLLGILMAIVTSLIFKKTIFKGEPVPFVMELPNYRLPSLKNVMQLLWEKAKDFIERAFTIIFFAVIVVWFLQNFSFGFEMVPDSADSMLAKIAGSITPLFIPLGFGKWQIIVSLITGFIAKETVVSSLNLLFPAGAITGILSVPSAISLLVFCLLYTPCVAAIASIKRELGGKSAAIVAFSYLAIAWICSFITFTLVNLII